MNTKIGGILSLVSETLFIYSLLNFVMISRIQYYSVSDSIIRSVFPSYILFFLFMCISGIIGWVGLIIPHVGRMIVGPDHRKLLPASFMIGAAYLLVIDNISRSLFSAEIPIGILTAIVGAPFFAYILRNPKAGWAG